VLLFALAVGGAAYGSYLYARSRAYFNVQQSSVYAYQGVPGSFAGIKLTWALGKTGIDFERLPTDLQAKLRRGVEFSLSDLNKLETYYRSKESSPAPAVTPSFPTSATPTPSGASSSTTP
jgi:protein phosphatase